MKKIYFLITISIILVLAIDVKSESVNLYGFKPVSVDSLPLFQPGNKPMQFTENIFVSLLAKIDKRGKLKSLISEENNDSLYLLYVESYLKNLKYSPAMLNNKKVKSILPIKIVFSKRINSPMFSFPLIYDTLITDNELFEYATQLNNVQLPKVLNFPPYFSDFNIMDTSNRYPVVVEKLVYEKGELIGIEKQMSTHDPFVGQIESAILYGNFQFPTIKGKEISGEIYLMVSFFPQLSYPVIRYDSISTDSVNIMNQFRLKIINKYSKFLSEPIPKQFPTQNYPRQLFNSYFNDPIYIWIKIDTTGNASVLRSGTSHKKNMSSIRKLVSKLKFYPALNQKNELVEFFGYIKIEPLNTIDIRISYMWMSLD